MKMLASDVTSPMLDPSIGTTPLLPGTSVIAEPSSSSSVVVSHPMAVDFDTSESRGLKRGLEGSDMEISEVCSFISDVNVNEEPHPSVPDVEFTDEEEWQAKSAELASFDEFEAKKDIPRDQANGPLLTFTWVRTVKNGMPNYRLCLRPFGRQSERSNESLYCPTPGPQIFKMMLVLAAHHGWSVRFFDVSRVSLHTPIKDPVFAVPPEEYHSPIPGGVWEMTMSVGGLEEAPADFDDHFGNVVESLSDDFGSLGLERLKTEPAAFRSKFTGVMMCKHMDDGVLVGESKTLDRTLTAMSKHLLMKTSNPQLGSETKFLGKLLIKTERGFQIKPLAKLFDNLLSSAGMGNCAPVHTPGRRSESRVPNVEPKLGPAEHKQYRTIVGNLMFLANERPDIQFCVKECARGVQNPSARDMPRAKRICRYLVGTRNWTLELEPWKDVDRLQLLDTLQMIVDSDWATDKLNRRSTSAGVAQLGGCTILTYSRSQGSPALSSAEAEGYALGSGACEGLFICSVAKELSVDLKLVVYSDSTATISQHLKFGLVRMKHVELRFLFVKDLVKREKLSLCKILGTDNRADLGTKMLDVTTHRYLCILVGLEPVKQAVEEVKGHKRNSQSSRSVGLQNVWKGLRTLCLGLAQWAQENSTSMNFHEMRI